MTSLSFEHVGLLFGIDVSNPNTVGIAMDGFDYELLLNNYSFVSGKQDEKLNIEANGTSRVNFPLSLKFVDIYNMINTLRDNDTTGYQIKLGLIFKLPVLGATRIPISHTGSFPIPKLPVISVRGLQLNSIGFTGAKLDLKIAIDNANAFPMRFDQLDYNLNINGQEWVSGINSSAMQVSDHGEGIITIPINLDFLKMGQSVYQLINGNKDLDYTLSGKVNMSSPKTELVEQSLPISQSGTINLSR